MDPLLSPFTQEMLLSRLSVLLERAWLPQLDAAVTLTNPEELTDAGGGHVVAWFAGIEDARCRFGVRADLLDNSDLLLGAMCHEIVCAIAFAIPGLVGSPRVAVIGSLAGVIIGWLIGRKVRLDECSGPNCQARLPYPADSCPSCDGKIAFEIARPQDHMEMLPLVVRLGPEEAFARYREQRAEARKRVLTNPLNLAMAGFVLLLVAVVIVGHC